MSLGDVYIAEETMHDRLGERRDRHAARQLRRRDDTEQRRWLTRQGCSLLCELGNRLVALGAWLEARGQLGLQH